MGFSRQKYWSRLLWPPPGDLPNPGIKPRVPGLQADSLSSEPPGKISGGKWKLIGFISWAPKSLQTVTGAMKLRHLLLGRNTVTNIDSILKSRDISLQTNVHIVKSIFFPGVTYGCEICTIK